MAWQIHRLVYRALSPLHIGYRSLGFIQRTRYYIPGRALWGAFTANITRFCLPPEKISPAAYQEIAEKVVDKCIRYTYFYPSYEDKPLSPQFSEKGLFFGKYSQFDFEHLFIGSSVHTAVEPQMVSAEENSLHETEYISHIVCSEGQIIPVSYIGYIFINEAEEIEIDGQKRSLSWNSEDSSLKHCLKDIFVGGERKYGMGRLRLESDQKINADFDGRCLIFENIFDLEKLKLKVEGGKPVPAHLAIEGCLQLKGDIEPLLGRELKQHGKSPELTSATLCWVPGSIADEDMNLEIGEYGILKRIRT